MAAPAMNLTANLTNYELEIAEMKRDGYTHEEVLYKLQQEKGVTVSLSTLKRQLRAWDLPSRRTKVGLSDELAERVNWLFHHTLLSDAQIASKVIEDDGLETSENQVQEIRLLFGWQRRHNTADKSTQQAAETQTLVQNLLYTGPGRSYGRRWAATYLRHQFGHRARDFDVANALRLFDPSGVTSRLPGMRKERLDDYITEGPDYLWCLDGHDKLAQYGIEIYAAVDAYSRKIVWFYVGSSNRTQLSVLRQYLRAIRARGLCPSFIRTDKGTETILLADAHFSFYIEAALKEEWPDEEYNAIQITDCYIYGPSTRNIRVEGLWRQQRFTTTGPWISYFRKLSLIGQFEQQCVADKVVLLFVFMPIIRSELQAFVDTHNAHRIRAQPKRMHHVAGVPDELYADSTRQCGFSLDYDVLDQWESRVAHYDFDSYLPESTMHWCEQQCAAIGHPSPPIATEFLQLGQEVFPPWYRELLFRARAYNASGQLPELALAPKPYLDVDELIRVQLMHELGYTAPE